MGFSNNTLFRQYTVLFLLLLVVPLFSQENDESSRMVRKAREMAFYSPEETFKITDHLLKKAQSGNDIVIVNLIEADIFIAKGEYNKTAENIFKANRLFESVTDSLKAEIIFHKAFLARTLKLYNQFDKYIREAEVLVSQEEDKSLQAYVNIQLAFEKANMLITEEKFNKAVSIIDSLGSNSKNDIDRFKLSDTYYLLKAKAYKGTGRYEDSYKFYQQALDYYIKIHKNTNALTESAINTGIAELDYINSDYDKAINILLISLKKAEGLENSYLLEKLNDRLALNYLALNDKEKHLKYNDTFLFYNKQVYDLEIAAVNAAYNFINQDKELNLKANENKLKAYLFLALGILFVIVLFGTFLYFINKVKRKRLKEIIGYLEVTNKLLLAQGDNVKTITPKKLNIPAETEQTILAGLKKFESSVKYTNKDMSLANLAAHLDTNTKYLSEIINKHYNDNFNAYINKLRVNYIIEKLKNEPEYLNYKISYLADESGFSSHSSFATVFKSITGIAPTVFIDLLGKEIHNKKA